MSPLPFRPNCTTNPQEVVKLYGELSVAALMSKQDRQLALWCILRSINRSGSSVLDFTRALATLTGYAYTTATARRVLNQGKGTFWDLTVTRKGQRRIILRSLEAVCSSLAVTRLSTPVLVSIEAFRGLKRRRAALYASWLSIRGDKPTSRELITRATGIGRRRQQRYDKLAGTSGSPTYAFYQGKPMMDKVEGKSRTWIIPRVLANAYIPNVTRAARGMTRKVSAKLRRCLESADATKRARRYFDNARQLTRCPNRQPEAYIRTGRDFLDGKRWDLVGAPA